MTAEGTRRRRWRLSSAPWATRLNVLLRPLHPHDRCRPLRLRPRNSGGGWRRPATSICRKYAGWYSVRDEAYYDESETAEAPDGSLAAPRPGTPVEWIEEESYFFRLSAYQDRLLAHYADNPGLHRPRDAAQRDRQLRPRRPAGPLDQPHHLRLGRCPCPGDPKHVMYVWVDALTNYVTGAGFPDENIPRWHYWPADVHIIGKDIVRFHAVYWPAFLMSAGLAAAQARLRPRLPVQPRREDVEVGRQRHRPVRAGRRLRRRPAALLLPARGAVRPGRQLFARGDRQPHQRRSRERPRQPGAALAVDDRAQLRRRGPGARRADRRPTRRFWPQPTRCPRRRGRR